MVEQYGKRKKISELEITGSQVSKILKIVIIGVAVLFLVFSSWYMVPAGERGILLTFGKPSEIVSEEGFHLKIPIAQKVVKMEVRTQKIEETADSSSKDLQDVKTTIALNYHIIPDETNTLYQTIGLAYRERVIQPTMQEAVKAISATFTAEELITKRPEVRNGIKEFLRERLSKSYLIVDDFNIVNFQFSEEFDRAIEQKVTAEQLKLKADRDLERIKVEAMQVEAAAIGLKNAKIANAQGEAESIKIIEEQLRKSPTYIDWYKVEKWDGILPIATSGMPFIDVRTAQKPTIEIMEEDGSN